jgi:hypothetical protein
MSQPAVHPDDVLEALLGGCSREQKRANLRQLHTLCAAQHAGTKDFSLPVIGKLWEATGGIKARALYNAPSEDYRTLVQSWQRHAGPVKARTEEARIKAGHEFIARIDDPAIKALVHRALIERDKLRAEVNLLKSLTHLNLDRSPTAATAETPSTQMRDINDAPAAAATAMQEQTTNPPKPTLTSSEREALERAIAADFLEDQGWVEGRSGEVLNERGRRLFEPGFTRAVRKILSN